ncbi:MAG: WG repeat-containing protein [Bryobacterales bacterium]|nr:WG repeat-containing protein [Bryobacterales bacterium]
MLLLTVGCARHSSPVHQAFIDRTGKVILRLPPQHWARSFSSGLAAVSVNGKYGFIDRQGKFIISPKFGGVREFHEGLAAVTSAESKDYWKQDTLFGFIDQTGQYVIPPQFNWVGDFSEGLAPVCIGACRGTSANERAGYIDRNVTTLSGVTRRRNARA